MQVLLKDRRTAERLGSAALLVATPDLAVSEYSLEPGSTPGDRHYHALHTDSFYVIDGELEFHTDGDPVRATAGTLLVAPRGAVHAFPVAIGAPTRFLNLHTPGLNWEGYLRELTALRRRRERPSAEFLKLHDIYDI